MKKIFLSVFVCIFFLSGCDLLGLFVAEDNQLVSQTVTVEGRGQTYLIKLNPTSNIVKGQYSGSARDAISENIENPNTSTDYFIQELNRKAREGLCSSIARSAGSDSAVANGYSTRTFNASENFWSYVEIQGNTKIPGKVEAAKKYEGNHCIVYADKTNSGISDQKYQNLRDIFEACFDLETAILGSPYYETYNSTFFVPCNQKIIILVSDLYGDAEQSSTIGYFYSGDLYNQNFLNNSSYYNKGKDEDSNDFIHSNECLIFYIDSQFLKNIPSYTYSTLVHEFNHMINYVVKTLKAMNNATSINTALSHLCNDWFTEMLSMTTEDMFQNYLGIQDQYSPKDRLETFSKFYCYGFRNWTLLERNSDTAGIAYANTYAFGAFLARNFGGIELISEIAKSQYVNEEAITKALQKVNNDSSLTFNYALQKFTLCVLNTQENDNFSLNRRVGYTNINNIQNSNQLGFSAIDIRGTVTSDGTIYDLPLTNLKNSVDVYPYGFTVHYIGNGISSFVLTTYKNNGLYYYYCVK